ncbi:peptidoglycan editing factor PgeF [Halalkalibacillus halophilus]|uniref:peptidoglycan editing factor PgeF n=1 Tax=Halalkalibacillus halophilus TaxID=392827 RepID=UPI00041D1703|nr:peptidoglycan editing factor PgeF [Halalkalibacillus halophilus]
MNNNWKLTDTHLHMTHWDQFSLRAGFSIRSGGVSKPPFEEMNVGIHVNDRTEDVLENRERFANIIGKPLSSWRCMNQVHSTTVLKVPELDESDLDHQSPQVNADGLITNNPEDVLITYYADCVPLYFIAPNSKWIGLAHAGWKGTVNGIAKEMVSALTNENIPIEEIQVAIGPCISKSNYEVDDVVKDQIPTRFHQKVITSLTNNKYLLDLKALNQAYLIEAGISEDYIYTNPYCTYEEENLFFSHRRDQGKTGRMLAYLTLSGE